MVKIEVLLYLRMLILMTI